MWTLRAWDERKKVMHNDFQFIRSGDTGADWIIFASDKHTLDASVKDPGKQHPFDDPYFAQQLKIMRGIGLEDKNGKSIFEGDIIKDMDGHMFTVVYEDAQWWATSIADTPIANPALDSSVIRRREYEVIGNGYETPVA